MPSLRTIASDIPAQPTRPNVIHIVADDMGWGDVSFSQARAPGDVYPGHAIVNTPQLEEMAAAGMTFNRFYAASPLCSPTRASVLTGRQGYRADIPSVPIGPSQSWKLRNAELTVAELAQTQGYATGHFGKWHVGEVTKHTYDWRRGRTGNYAHYSPPWQNGYDVSFSGSGLLPVYDPYDVKSFSNAGQVSFFTGPSDAALTTRVPNDARINDKYEAEIVVDQAIDFIEAKSADSTPFLTTLWFSSPHHPFVETPSNAYDGLGLSTDQRRYFESITAMDEQIGRLRAKLDELGIAENTIIMFQSDNGPQQALGPGAWGSAGGLRGEKGDPWEGGIRVPMLVEWKGRIAAGSSTDAPGSTNDILPTLLDLWGVEMPDDRALDGASLRDVLDGSAAARPDDFKFFTKWFASEAAMDNRFKLVTTGGQHYTLFDLLTDPGEQAPLASSGDVASRSPAIQAKFNDLRTALDQWRAAIVASGAGVDYETRIANASANAVVRADAELSLPLQQIGVDAFGGEVYEDKYRITGDNAAFRAAGKVSVFIERQYATLRADLAADGSGAPGTYDQPSPESSAHTIAAGTVVHSFLLHFNPGAGESISTSIVFEDDILGVVAKPELLDASDHLAFAEPVFDVGGSSSAPSRGTLYGEATDGGWVIGPDGRTLTVSFAADAEDYDQLRVITRSSLQMLPPPVTAAAAADFNGDNVVDGADFLTWQRHFNAAGATKASGDANGDQAVDGSDLAVWRAQYGTNIAAGAATAVAEPASLLLAAATLAGLTAMRQYRR